MDEGFGPDTFCIRGYSFEDSRRIWAGGREVSLDDRLFLPLLLLEDMHRSRVDGGRKKFPGTSNWSTWGSADAVRRWKEFPAEFSPFEFSSMSESGT